MLKAFQVNRDENLELMLRLCERVGFRYVSIGFHESAPDLNGENWQDIEKRIGTLLARYHLQCVQTHLPTPYDPLASSEVRDEALERAIERCISVSAALGASWCVCHPRSAVHASYDTRTSLADNRKAIERYLLCAKREKIGLAVENMPVFKGMPAWYCTDYHDLASLVDSFDDDGLRACWDFGHANTAGFSHPKALEYMGNRIACTHIHDNFTDGDNHFVPFHGTVPWDEVIPQLKANGYRGALTLEIFYRNSPVLESYLRHSFDCIQYLDSLIGG